VGESDGRSAAEEHEVVEVAGRYGRRRRQHLLEVAQCRLEVVAQHRAPHGQDRGRETGLHDRALVGVRHVDHGVADRVHR
jgi:hypothetical protein